MAARSLQSVTITFGLVTIPVKMYAATNPRAGVSFTMLDAKGGRVKQQYISAESGEVVARNEMIKGYEFEKDRFVTFTKEELKALEQVSSGAIDITEFVPAASIDPVYYEKAYYLGPDKGGAKPYRLLANAMRDSGRSAIGRWAARGKQYLVNIRVVDKGLVLQELLYADEVRPIDDVEIPDANVSPKELALATQLIDSITSEAFDPTQYKDDVQERIEAQIQKKVEGEEITVPEGTGAPASAKVIDIMDALRASLNRKADGKVSDGSATRASSARKAKQPEAKKAAKKVANKTAKKNSVRKAA
ncbi:MAG TPA: Ku protein [Burkholderiaceae bacterium]|jgi:DNA end-binding protein Ku|nr:Ku protein [Burkholderiaceae bacterium]